MHDLIEFLERLNERLCTTCLLQELASVIRKAMSVGEGSEDACGMSLMAL